MSNCLNIHTLINENIYHQICVDGTSILYLICIYFSIIFTYRQKSMLKNIFQKPLSSYQMEAMEKYFLVRREMSQTFLFIIAICVAFQTCQEKDVCKLILQDVNIKQNYHYQSMQNFSEFDWRKNLVEVRTNLISPSYNLHYYNFLENIILFAIHKYN